MRANSVRTHGVAHRARWMSGAGVAVLVAVIAFGVGRAGPLASRQAVAAPAAESSVDEAAARQAFLAAYTVFMHPRCMNCHPAGDVPLQGDDSRLHGQNVKRGTDGKGLYALKCSNCHQDENRPGAYMPPGNPTWHLPPAAMSMVFEGKTPAQLARALKDPELNGGRSLEQLLHHVANDKLVLWGWKPGEGRTKPPLSHDDFVANMNTWIEGGAPIPE